LPILAFGLATMNSFGAESLFFERQLMWIIVSIATFFIFSFIDFRFLKSTRVLVSLFLLTSLSLVMLFMIGNYIQGASRWLDLGFFTFQPSDPAKLVLILVLAKYFSRRHVDIAQFRHIVVSGLYALTLAGLIFLQPDFGSSIIIMLLWFGITLVSGISKRHLLVLLTVGVLAFTGLWVFALGDYQKTRIETFFHPYADLQGAGYNAYQSQVAIGSGQIFGKGVGYGTQSRLKFLPEYETDFIFAAFSEEWGFIGAIILFALYGIVIWRILVNSARGHSNFEMLFGIGLAVLFMSHFAIHVGANIGLLPVTGTTLPFMSYGGSHLVTSFAGLGVLMGMRRYARVVSREVLSKNHFMDD
jgi:rod shape determining protein RodA